MIKSSMKVTKNKESVDQLMNNQFFRIAYDDISSSAEFSVYLLSVVVSL